LLHTTDDDGRIAVSALGYARDVSIASGQVMSQIIPGDNTAQTCVMRFVNGMTVDIAYALRGMHLQLSGTQAFRIECR